jgi:hypothetical protein
VLARVSAVGVYTVVLARVSAVGVYSVGKG